MEEQQRRQVRSGASPRSQEASPISRLLPKILVSAIIVGGAFAWRSPTENPTPGRWIGDGPPPNELQVALDRVFAGPACVTAGDAGDALVLSLQELGYADWTVDWGPGVRADGCVSSTIDTVGKRIIFIMALRPEVKLALTRVAEDLLDRCLGIGEATALITFVLTDLGETNWELRTDGPIGGPLDRLDEVVGHVQAGCTVYSGTGWTEDGTRLYFIAGPTTKWAH